MLVLAPASTSLHPLLTGSSQKKPPRMSWHCGGSKAVASPVAAHSHRGSPVCVVKWRQVGCCTTRSALSRFCIQRRAALCDSRNLMSMKPV